MVENPLVIYFGFVYLFQIWHVFSPCRFPFVLAYIPKLGWYCYANCFPQISFYSCFCFKGLHNLLRNSCFKNTHTENKLTFSAGFKYLYKGGVKKNLIILLSGISEVRLFKLLEDYNGGVCSDTECNFKHKTIIGSNYILSWKETLIWAQIHIHPAFPKKLLYNYTKQHHWCPTFPFKAPASEHPPLRHNTCPKPTSAGSALWCCMYCSAESETEEVNVAGKTLRPDMAYGKNELGLYDKGLVFTNSHTSCYFWPTVDLVSQLSTLPPPPFFLKKIKITCTCSHLYWDFFSNTGKSTEEVFALKFFGYFHVTVARECLFTSELPCLLPYSLMMWLLVTSKEDSEMHYFYSYCIWWRALKKI